MKLVKIGDKYGAYVITNKASKYTNRGSKCYECECSICGGRRIFSESYLMKLKGKKECICEEEERKLDIKREFDYLQKNYGKVNLCGSCKYLFTCVKHIYNAIDKRYMKKYYIDVVKDYNRKRNVIIMLECDRFEFDWGEKDSKK